MIEGVVVTRLPKRSLFWAFSLNQVLLNMAAVSSLGFYQQAAILPTVQHSFVVEQILFSPIYVDKLIVLTEFKKKQKFVASAWENE